MKNFFQWLFFGKKQDGTPQGTPYTDADRGTVLVLTPSDQRWHALPDTQMAQVRERVKDYLAKPVPTEGERRQYHEDSEFLEESLREKFLVRAIPAKKYEADRETDRQNMNAKR